MKIGIVGMPNIGKSTLFNALTKSYAAPAENFPFCTINPNIGIVDVKDPRVDKLAEMSSSKKKIYSSIEFVDIAGLVKGASKGEGLGNKFLSHIREVDAIVQVLRYFKDSEVVHVEGAVDPMRDVEIINTELIFSDLEIIERNLPNLAKKTKVGKGNKDEIRLVEILMEIQEALIQGKIAHNIKDKLSKDDLKLIKSYNFLTTKPIVYAINIGQEDIPFAHEIANDFMTKLQSPVAIVCAKLESEMMEMSDEEKDEFIRELLSIDKVTHIPTLNDLIKLGFEKVGLMYYFTTGEDETRSWTIPIGSTAPQAAGAIHTDFEKGFIKAEIVSYNDIISTGSRSKAKEKGLVRLEGKEYIVKDGDVIIFKFNV
ncbi:MAG: redox-regulated ATPase YchF [candidate division SR1 bacterium]|nr:redox-regulated ATPase YchF [candidate division SR1 bacterium]